MTATVQTQQTVDTQVVLPVIPVTVKAKSGRIVNNPAKSAYTLTETGIVWGKKVARTDVDAAMGEVNGSTRRIAFLQADVILQLADTFKVSVADVAAGIVTTEGSPMSKNYAETLLQFARKVPISSRRADLSVTHHVEVKNLPPDEQVKFLAIAAKDNLSVAGLRNAIKAEKPTVNGRGSNGHSSKPRTPVAPTVDATNAPLDSPAHGITTDTQGRRTEQPVVTTSTNPDRVFLTVEPDQAKTIAHLAKLAGVEPTIMLRKLLASAIGAEQRRNEKLQPSIAAEPEVPAVTSAVTVEEVPAPVQETPPATAIVKPAKKRSGKPAKAADDAIAQEVVIPVSQAAVAEIVALYPDATAEEIAERLGASVDAVSAYMPNTTSSATATAQRFGMLETGQ